MKLRVLVAIDSSVYSQEVLGAVSSCRWDAQTALHVITVIEPAVSWEVTEQYIHQNRVVLEDRVNQLKEALPKCDVTWEVLDGPAGETIVEAAREFNADLLIIGSHGDTGPRASKAGSVASSIVDNAPCSVQVVKVRSGNRPQEKRLKMAQAS